MQAKYNTLLSLDGARMTEISSVSNATAKVYEGFERQREHYEQRKVMQEHHNKKIAVNKRLLEAYMVVLDRLEYYNKQRQIETAKAEQGRFLDVEVK